ncbi:hypothetical protein FRC12_013589 [Ceratobasidium sp. 428]|nr:hypothetical protein FRC12_013589 [Ceratobasidium sp. 428]
MKQSIEEKEREKRQREKIERLKLSRYKTKLPTVYDGAADFNAYEQWLFEMHTWIRDPGFDEEEAVLHTKAFLEGKKVTVELFAYCFPPDINARLRKKFAGLKQADKGLRDFIRALQKYQKRLSDITDIQVAQRMWEGAYSYLRIEWAKASYSAKERTVDELEESGMRFEMAERVHRNEEDRRIQTNKDRENKPYRSNRKDESSTESNNISYSRDSRESRSAYTQRTNNRNDWRNKRDTNQGPRLTQEQRKRYRAAGRCFNCSEVGHTARDYPKRNQARPTSLSSSAINFAHIEELGNKRRGLEINHIHLASESDFGDDEEDDDDDAYSQERTIEDQIDASIELYATNLKKNKERRELEKHAATLKDLERKVANAIIVEMLVNGEGRRVLLDSGSLGDFISSTVVHRLGIRTDVLAKPIGQAMAVAGSRGVIKHSAIVNIKYRNIDDTYRPDVASLDRYELILGTTFMHRHSIMLGFNPESVLVRSNKLLPLDGPTIRTISLNATEKHDAEGEKTKESLTKSQYQLHGTKIRIHTDERSLIDVLTQKNWSEQRVI